MGNKISARHFQNLLTGGASLYMQQSNSLISDWPIKLGGMVQSFFTRPSNMLSNERQTRYSPPRIQPRDHIEIDSSCFSPTLLLLACTPSTNAWENEGIIPAKKSNRDPFEDAKYIASSRTYMCSCLCGHEQTVTRLLGMVCGLSRRYFFSSQNWVSGFNAKKSAS